MGVTNVTTLRFVTIKCGTLRADNPNDIFSKVLRAITASKTSLDGDRALETLGRLTEPSRLFTVVRKLDKEEQRREKRREEGVAVRMFDQHLFLPLSLFFLACVSRIS